MQQGEMQAAYYGEQKTSSRCGRLDQACAFGIGPVSMTFDGNDIDVERIKIKKHLYWVFASLMAAKNTIRILSDLNSKYPFMKSEKDQPLYDALGKDSIIQEIYARLILYNFCECIVQKTILPKMARKHTYIINFTRAVQVCRKYLRLPKTVFFDVRALICQFLSPVRIDRGFARLIKRKGFTSFAYRIA